MVSLCILCLCLAAVFIGKLPIALSLLALK